MANFGHVFGCSFWSWFSLFLVRPSTNLAKKIQTCRGQSRESKNLPRTKPRTKSVRTPTRKLKSQSLVPPDSFPYRNAPDSENVRRRYSPPGGLQSAAQRGRRVEYGPRVLPILPPILLPHSSSRRFLSPPPKSSPSSLGPTPSAAAKNGAGASWRLLGRKNRVPRGLQKLIKF